MKWRVILFLAAMGVIIPGVSKGASQAHVVRISLAKNSMVWKMRVDAGHLLTVTSHDLTNELGRLHLRQGDIMIFGSAPTRRPGPQAQTWNWLANFCERKNVAMYSYGAGEYVKGQPLFSVPVYHWTAPFENPFDLSHAAFFLEGKLLGKAQKGLDNMLSHISRTKPKEVFILGSLYDINRSFPPNPTPFEHERSRIEAILRADGTELIEMDILPGF